MHLFENKWQILLFCGICFIGFCLNLGYEYYKFIQFKSTPQLVLDAQVQRHYPKNDYFVYKLKTKDFSFYTTKKFDTNATNVRLKVSTKKVSFIDFLRKSFYMRSWDFKEIDLEPTVIQRVQNFISSQHENQKLKELYLTLFFATAMSKELRQNVTNWGVAHIISISGFHMSLLFTFLFFIFSPFLRFIYDKFYPYRDYRFDLSVVIFCLMAGYLYVLNFTPSFLRSFTMGLIGFFLLSRGFKVFRFENLFLAVLIAILFNISLIFSIGFYFSSLGVFFIFLYTHHFIKKQDLSSKLKMIVHTLYLEIFVFSAMNIPVYYFFNSASLFQISVIPLGYVFIVFYPLSILLHIIGFGGLLDDYMLKFLDYANEQAKITITFWAFILFNISLPFTIMYKKLAILVAACGFIVFCSILIA